jgi:AcrR family transcriptional regulator
VRRAVLDAALAALAECGYADLSADDIARRAGVHRSTVHRRWPTVGALVLDALLDRSAQTVPVADSGSVRDDLRRFVQGVADSLTSPLGRALVTAFYLQAADDPAVGDLAARFWASRFDLAGAIVRRAVERGELPAEADPELVVEALVAPLYLRSLVTRRPLTATFLDDLVDLVVAGAGPGRAASG